MQAFAGTPAGEALATPTQHIKIHREAARVFWFFFSKKNKKKRRDSISSAQCIG